MSKTAKQDIYIKKEAYHWNKNKNKRNCAKLYRKRHKKTNIAYQRAHTTFLCIQFRLGQAQYPFGSELFSNSRTRVFMGKRRAKMQGQEGPK